MLSRKINVITFHFNSHCTLIDYFLKTIAKRLVHFHGTADDLAGEF